ncbi:MAG: hypothetical protein C0404_03800 [Verrucomicrobia bacterium]|nr:hypothetical protein [Verrucomicrobiota bacterium]
MKKILTIAAAVLLLGILVIGFLFPCMRPPRPDEYVPSLAMQELRQFKSGYDSFLSHHGNTPPPSISVLVDAGYYLRGVVEPHRTRIMSQLEYPYANSNTNQDSNILAVYHVEGFGTFFLTADGKITEKRLSTYAPDTFRKIQNEKWKKQSEGHVTK